MIERQIKETNKLALILTTVLVSLIGGTGIIEILTDPPNIFSKLKVVVMVLSVVLNLVYARKQTISVTQWVYSSEGLLAYFMVIFAATEVSACVYCFPLLAIILMLGNKKLMIGCIVFNFLQNVYFGIKMAMSGAVTVGGTALLIAGIGFAAISFWFLFKIQTKHSDEQLEEAEEQSKQVEQASKKNAETVLHVKKVLSGLASGFTEVLGNIDSVNRSMEEVAAGVEAVAKNAEEEQGDAERVFDGASEVGAASERAMTTGKKQSETIRTQSEITDNVSSAAEKIDEQMKKAAELTAELERNTKDIVNMAELVNEIAGRTNLLSLNASIEAARAGEAGRGFAVVAEEIRSLADNTKETVSRMNESVNRILASVKEVTAYTMESGASAATQLALSGKLREANEDMERMTSDVLSDVTDVKKASEVSLNSIRELTDRITNLTAFTEEQTASSEQVVKMSQDSQTRLAELVNAVTELDEYLG